MKPTDLPPDEITSFRGKYAFLSNFAPSRFTAAGRSWPSVEHAFQAMKAKLDTEKEWVAAAPTPGEAKRRGRGVVLIDEWANPEVRVAIMLALVRKKFEQNKLLRRLLLETGDAEIVEGNSWGDTFWGVDTKKGGENHLGKILMQVRAELKAKSS